MRPGIVWRKKCPIILMHIAEVIARRLGARNRSQPVLAPLASIAVVPTSPEVMVSQFATRLAAGLATIGSTLHLSSRQVGDIWGEEGVTQKPINDSSTINLDNWLNDQEDKYRFVLYEADSGMSNWTQRCIRQADHILVVGLAGADSVPGEIEKEFLSSRSETTPAGQTLVLLHGNGAQRPCGTQQWLTPRRVERCHHVRLDADTDFNRLVRLLTGSAIGLVLGGGGARGFAHMGVIRALTEANITIDFVGGTSMGAIIAGEYAYGYDYDSMIRLNKELFHRANFDYTFPLTALLAARNAAKKLVKFFGEVQIEDLWLPFFCVSANLTRAELMIHRTGLLRKGLRASASIPGITPPVSDNGNLLVDGSVLNNLPIDVMSQFCTGGKVIAVDVSAQIDLVDSLHYGESLSGWKTLWHRVNPFGPSCNVPNIASILLRSAELATLKDQHKMLEQWSASPYLRPPVENFQILDFDSIEEVAEVGYNYTKKKIEKWREDGDWAGIVSMSS